MPAPGAGILEFLKGLSPVTAPVAIPPPEGDGAPRFLPPEQLHQGGVEVMQRKVVLGPCIGAVVFVVWWWKHYT